MPVFLDNPYNPNPISKLMVTFLLGFAVFHKVNIYFEWAIILLISFLFYKNGFKKEALKNILFFGMFSLIIPSLEVIRNMNVILMIFFMLFAVCRMFYLPFSSGSFFVKTSHLAILAALVISSSVASFFPILILSFILVLKRITS